MPTKAILVGTPGYVPVPDFVQIVQVKLHDLASHRVGDEDCVWGRWLGGDGPRNLFRLASSEEVVVGGQQMAIVGVIQANLAVAHDHQERFASVAEVDLDWTEIFGTRG